MNDLTQRGSPPSTYAILSALENEPGSAQRVASTLGITLGLMGYYSYCRSNGRAVT